jgi:ribosomal protein L11 methyltransferase
VCPPVARGRTLSARCPVPAGQDVPQTKAAPVRDHHRYTLALPPGEDAEVTAARLWAAGALGVWTRPDTLVSWFETPTDDVPGGGSWAPEPARDWQAEWKATVAPVHAGRFAVVPSWLADEHAAAADEHAIVLDPGQAFGSGHHATTTLCLELLSSIDLTGARVLDVGCGTGVLAIAAALAGAGEVTAVDVDADAVAVTRRNAAANHVAVTARVGSVDGATPRHDVVLANLVTDTVAALAAPLAAATGSHLVTSGIATEREDRALDALVAAGLAVDDVRRRDGWTAAHLIREVPT